MQPDVYLDEKFADTVTNPDWLAPIKENIIEIHELIKYQFSISLNRGSWFFLDHRNTKAQRARSPFPCEKWILLADLMKKLETHLDVICNQIKNATPQQNSLNHIEQLNGILKSEKGKYTGSIFANRSTISDIIDFTEYLKEHHQQSVEENALNEDEKKAIAAEIDRVDHHLRKIKEQHIGTLETQLKQCTDWKQEKVQSFIKEYKKQCWLGTGNGLWFFGWALPRSHFGRMVFEEPKQLTWEKIEKYVNDCNTKDKNPTKRASVRAFELINQPESRPNERAGFHPPLQRKMA